MPRINFSDRRGVGIIGLLMAGMLFTAGSLYAQNSFDALRYSMRYPGSDPVGMVMPGTAYANDVGVYIDNPASAAMFKNGMASFGLSFRNVSEQAGYLGNQRDFSDQQTNIGDFGFVYKAPTSQGSLVFGVGYNQVMDFNSAVKIDARNNRSTITDMFNQTDFYYDIAFNSYALDWADIDSTYTLSIFRIGFPAGQFPGIGQYAEVTQRGHIGEYSVFGATEFQKNLMVGLSIGIPAGSYSYERRFLEEDTQNDYNGNFIDSNGDGYGETDISNMLSVDKINADISGFRARVGLVYKVNPYFQVGGSYEFQSTLSIDESYSSDIQTTMDDGTTFSDGFDGENKYKIVNPARIKVGAALMNLAGLTVSGSAEYVDYTQMEMKDLDNLTEIEENDFIDTEFQEVWNLRVGAEFAVNEQVRPRIGYAYYPSMRKSQDVARSFINGGLGIGLTDQMTFDVGVQYSTWNDEMVMYNYYPQTNNNLQSEVASEDISRWHVMAGLSIKF